MAFTEVTKAPTSAELSQLKREYRKLCREYDELKYQFKEHINDEDFEVLSVDDFLKLKEVYMLKKSIYWKIHRLENPNDTATETAYRFLNSMSHNDQVDFLMEHDLTTHRLIDEIKKNPNFIEEVTV